MIALDTTVLVYAVGSAHPLAEPARTVVAAISDGRLRGTTTVEVIQEFVHVRARRRGRGDAAELGRAFGALLGPLLAPDDEDLDAGLHLYERTSLGAVDAVLAATALDRGAAVVSADRAFGEVPALDFRPLDGAWVGDAAGR